MALVERQVVLKQKGSDGNTYMNFPVTRIDYVEGGVGSVNGTIPDENGNIELDVGGDVRSVNGVRPDETGNVEIKAGVVSVDDVTPDEETGNIDLGDRRKDAASRTDILEAFKSLGLDSASIAKELEIVKNKLIPYLINFETLGVSTFAEAPEGWFKVNAGSETYSDCPDTCWGSLLYIKGVGTPCQKYIVDNGHTVYHRSWDKSTNTWGTWTAVSNDYVTGFSVSGAKVTYTKKDGTTGSFTVGSGASANAYITSRYSSGTQWYRKWSDGWIEQGGYYAISHTPTGEVKSLITAFSGTNYTIVANAYGNGAFNDNLNAIAKTTTTFTMAAGNKSAGDNPPNGFYFYACGY